MAETLSIFNMIGLIALGYVVLEMKHNVTATMYEQ